MKPNKHPWLNSILTLIPLVFSSLAVADSQAEQAARALAGQHARSPTSAESSADAYPWEQVLNTPKHRETDKGKNMATLAGSASGDGGNDIVETPAQRYYRVVEEYRLNHPSPPDDTLGEILKRHEAHPWPPHDRE